MITTEVKIVHLFQIKDNPNWFDALLFVKVSEHPEGGNQISAHAGYRHKIFWMREFNLTEEEFNKLIVC